MNKLLILSASLLAATGAVQAQELGRVVSSTPVIQPVAVQQQSCGTTPMVVQAPKSGAGALVGAVAGGAIGNALGGGAGRAVATAAGLMGGAILGDHIEGAGATQVAQVPQCSTQTVYENRQVGYNVVYEYGGRQHTAMMANDPGPTVQLQVNPVVQGVGSAPVNYGQSTQTSQITYTQPIYTEPTTVVTQTVYPTTTYTTYAPAYYPQPYYVAPSYYPAVTLGVGLGLGYWAGSRGGYRGGYYHGGGWRGGRGWR
ncbi:hypothetical protein PSQ40_10365 [Curvibacter sp. HBC61]|uniref:Glycine zipper 2TM domain-containing protein n=1 Tax=Curvibacter cyanobacteriorum TaxID=3026422 RepID=A0ABT5N075_9BURK|nr:hypothetical protein [Curvibacter sp. HBC61]MDD0838974.1 hypothetical protein [Curvibacter sp. HBC61]